ncbi:hypothetical protein TNCV_970231 [Trichonephila clavipes]|nr:hypothetical protein TNCV_970231 [Trichonephila clavipes]
MNELCRFIRAVACFVDDASRNKSPERILRIDLTSPLLLVKAFSIRKGETLYASTHHGAQQGEAARRSSDMRQARHLPQRWYWSIVLQVRDVIRQFTQGTNCNTNPKATVFGIPKEPVLESAELITSRLTGAGSLLPPVYGEAWAKGHATGTPDSTFPCTGRRTRQTCGSDSKLVLTLRKAKVHHSSAGGKSVSCCLRKADLSKTVARRLRGGGLYARRPVVCVPLTRQHRTARLQWCREHHNWTEQDWACILFSDESRFSLSSDCRHQLIWRESGTYRPENIQEKD